MTTSYVVKVALHSGVTDKLPRVRRGHPTEYV